MSAAVVRRCVSVAVLLAGAGGDGVLAQQAGDAPLRKTDLVRLLTLGTLASGELVARVRRSCLSFTPTERDRADLVALGADSVLLREIGTCTRRPAVARAAPRPPGTPRRSARVAPPVTRARVEPDAVRPTPLSTIRTAFVRGVGQRASAGTRPPLPLIFEVRDTAGLPVAGEPVALGVTNGQLGAARAVTDSSGRLQVAVTLGPRVGSTVVRATVRALEREATLYAGPGAPTRLLLRCGDTPVERKVALTTNVPALFHVTGQDAFGNAAPLAHLQVVTGDKRVLRALVVAEDSTTGLVRVTPGEPGSTSLVVVASGHREDLTAVVLQKSDSGPSCSRPG